MNHDKVKNTIQDSFSLHYVYWHYYSYCFIA